MIPFIDLGEQYRLLKDKIDANILKVLTEGKYIMGPEIAELEQKLADFVGVKYCISCASGTDALLMPLMAWEIGEGDAVFTTPFTFVATAAMVKFTGATPVFVDIDPDTYNLNPNLLETAILKVIHEGKLTPKAIIPVDLFGLPADYDPICAIAKKYKLKILEDAAQGFGGNYKGKRAGGFGNAGTTSFFPAKPLGCYGDGGAIFTDDEELYTLLKSIRVHGQGSDKYDNVRVGINGRLDTLQAAILLPKLEVFPVELELRNQAAAKYTEKLKNIVKTPTVPDGLISCWAQYSVLAKDSEERTRLLKNLKIAGVPTAVYYPKPLHLQTVYKKTGYKEGDFPVSEDASKRIFSIPMHPYLTDEVIEIVAAALRQ